MKILIVPSANLPIPPVSGGAVQNLIYEYVKYNETYGKDDISLVTICDSKTYKKEKFNHTKFIYVKIPRWILKIRNYSKKPFSSFAYRWIAYKYLNKVKSAIKSEPDRTVVFENTVDLVKKLKKPIDMKWVMHIYNDILSDTSCENVISKLDKVIACSEYIKNRVYCNKDKVSVVYNGVDIDKFSVCNRDYNKYRESMRKELNISSDEVAIITVARLVPEKGVKELVQAFNKIDKNKKVKLIIVGNKLYGEDVKDNYLKEIKKMAEINEEKIVFTGYISYEELYKYYWACDIGVLATLYDEPFSMAAIEYLASGLIPIFTRAGGFPEMINNEKFLIERAEIVDELNKTLNYVIDNYNSIKTNNDFYEIAHKYSIFEYCQGKKKELRGISK